MLQVEGRGLDCQLGNSISSIDPILPALGSTQPLTEMSTPRNLPGGKGWSVPKTDSLSAIYEPIL
jgi:hypothetical protein